MKISLLAMFFAFAMLNSCHSDKIASAPKENSKWVSLFDGKTLDHWIPKIAGYKLGQNFGNTFRVEKGILKTRYDEYDDGFNKKFGALFYDKKFTNFRLRVQYRFIGNTAPGGPPWGYRDGGIQYYCQPPKTMKVDQPFPVCLEYNLLGGNGKEDRPSGEICASGMTIEIHGKLNTSYCTTPFVEKTFSGNKWVTAEIDVRDGKIIHFVNGEKIIEFENPRYIAANALAKKFVINGDDRVRDGYISLQSNSHPMDFRKIEIMEY
ncbi:MAG: DUF1080 domain-containing protein [Ginsengibacter sp.]